mmetsp:Transcript_21660/g.48921  ORF Transcript_21660/g.48921 Transcript_21660/m.48921 type:complete len:289 (-) Transcript_21660:206-1072(-)
MPSSSKLLPRSGENSERARGRASGSSFLASSVAFSLKEDLLRGLGVDGDELSPLSWALCGKPLVLPVLPIAIGMGRRWFVSPSTKAMGVMLSMRCTLFRGLAAANSAAEDIELTPDSMRCMPLKSSFKSDLMLSVSVIYLPKLCLMCSTCFCMRFISNGLSDTATCHKPWQKSSIPISPCSFKSRASKSSTASSKPVRSRSICCSRGAIAAISSRETSPELSSSSFRNISRSSAITFFLFCSSIDCNKLLSFAACSRLELTITAVTRFMMTMPTTKITSTKYSIRTGS